MIYSEISSIGLRRQVNEDFFGNTITDLAAFHIVCDGMGGHVAGATASKLATESFLNFVNESKSQNIPELLKAAIENANEIVVEAANKKPELKGMGSTLVVTAIKDNKLYYAHVGDSRIYLLRGNSLTQLTEDHSFVAEMVKAGIITEQEAKTHPRKNEITKAIGIRSRLEPTICKESIHLKKGDFILLCTDGLTNMVHEDVIRDIVSSNENIEEKAKQLIDAANNAGGHDNSTVSIIEITDITKKGNILQNFNFKKSWIKRLFFTILLAIMTWFIIDYFTKDNSNIEENHLIKERKTPIKNEKIKAKSHEEIEIKKVKIVPKKRSEIKYDLSCMSDDSDGGTVDFINFLSSTRDEMIDVATLKVSAKKEMEYGKIMHEELATSEEISSNARLNTILNRLTANLINSPYNYRIFEIKDNSINAFTVGAYIYIHSGMLSFVNSDDELAAIIAHEINHNELGHINKKLSMNETARSFIGKDAADLAMALEGMATSSFNQKDETMCDLYGLDLMIQAGFSPCATVDLWKRMSKSEGNFNNLENMMRSHPYSSKRAVCTKNHLEINYALDCLK